MTNPGRMDMTVLESGNCEPLKAAVHGLLLAITALCAAYNTAAWLRRRQRHLAINSVIYTAAMLWERCHVAHHLAACDSRVPTPLAPSGPAPQDLSDAA